MSILRLMRHIMYMLQNENFNRENKKLNRNAHVFKLKDVCYEKLHYESRLYKSKSKTSTFPWI